MPKRKDEVELDLRLQLLQVQDKLGTDEWDRLSRDRNVRRIKELQAKEAPRSLRILQGADQVVHTIHGARGPGRWICDAYERRVTGLTDEGGWIRHQYAKIRDRSIFREIRTQLTPEEIVARFRRRQQ